MLSSMNDAGAAGDRALTAAGWLLLATAAVVAASSSARLVWSVLDLRHPPTLPAAAAGRADPGAGQGATPAVDLAALHLFGQAGLQAQPTLIEAPETQLALALLGTAAADDPTGGLAIIAEEGGQQGYYRAGDALPGGAELKEIHVDRIVLVRQGRAETLRLERELSGTAAGTGTTPRRSGGRPTAASSRRAAPTQPADWQSIRSQSRLDPQKLMQLGSQIRALPFSENGKPIGVRLVASRDATLIHRLGLRSSDVIMSVNGISLTDPGRQLELMRLLNSQSQFQVRLRRNGSDMTVNIDAGSLQSEVN